LSDSHSYNTSCMCCLVRYRWW